MVIGKDGRTEKIGFLLVPEFLIHAVILALEALRIANQNAGRRLFSTNVFTVDGPPVPAAAQPTGSLRASSATCTAMLVVI